MKDRITKFIPFGYDPIEIQGRPLATLDGLKLDTGSRAWAWCGGETEQGKSGVVCIVQNVKVPLEERESRAGLSHYLAKNIHKVTVLLVHPVQLSRLNEA